MPAEFKSPLSNSCIIIGLVIPFTGLGAMIGLVPIATKYIFLIFAVLIPFYNIIYFTYNYFKNKTYKSNLIYTIITISLNFLFLFIFLILELTSPNFVVQVGKPLFLIDFALSIPVGSYILIFDLLFTLIISVISLVKLIRSKKSLNKVEETTNN